MKIISVLVIALMISGCVINLPIPMQYQAFEGKEEVVNGEGGTRVIVDDIDFWGYGTPPKKYVVIGTIVGSSIADDDYIRFRAAKEIKKRGGNAALEVSITGAGRQDASRYKFVVIKYI